MRLTFAFITALAILTAFAANDPPALAGTNIEVDRTDDPSPIPAACTTDPNDCSLRGAIEFANSNPLQDTILIPAGTYTLELVAADEDLNQTGDLDIQDSVTIVGAGDGTGAGSTIIDGADHDRVIDIYPQAIIGTVNISNVRIRNGMITGFSQSDVGGGIRTYGGTVTLSNVTVTSNTTQMHGGGIYQGALTDLVLNNVEVSDNTADDPISLTSGGGLFKTDGLAHSLVITNSVFSGNVADQGGGLGIGLASMVSIQDTTIAGNSATIGPCTNCADGGGGLYIPATTVNFTGGNITGNDSTAGGGGVLATGVLHISGAVVSGNSASHGGGLALYNDSSTVSDTVVSSNTAVGPAGGIRAQQATIANSTISGNTAGTDGGGLSLEGGTLTTSSVFGNNADRGGGVFEVADSVITNSTVSGNTATSAGGGLFKGLTLAVAQPEGGPFPGPTSLRHLTIADNAAPAGANLYNLGDAGPLNLGASIVAGANGAANCSGLITSLGYNVDDDGSCGLSGTDDVSGADAMLAALANNGGPTQTHALVDGSPAIDLVVAGCPPPTTDQRGQPRPMGNACDAGAFESTFAAPTPTSGPTPTPSPSSTVEPSDTATPIETPTGEPTETPTPTPSSESLVWGDNNCSGQADPVDALLALRHDAGLSTNTGECPGMGAEVEVLDGSPHLWGDIDCSNQVDPVDALKLLRYDAALSITQEPSCPPVGSEVEVLTT